MTVTLDWQQVRLAIAQYLDSRGIVAPPNNVLIKMDGKSVTQEIEATIMVPEPEKPKKQQVLLRESGPCEGHDPRKHFERNPNGYR